MKAYEISLFVMVICIAMSILTPTGIFTGGPSKVEYNIPYDVPFVVGILIGGGIAIMGFIFKLQAALVVFSTLYGTTISVAGAIMYVYQIPPEIIGAVMTMFTFIGVWAAFQIASGGMGVME